MKRIPLLLAGVALIAVAALALPGCGGKSSNAKDAGAEHALTAVEISVLKPTTFREAVSVTGTVASFEDARVPADEGGRLLAWAAPLGAVVRQGQVLVQLDSVMARAAYDAAVAQFNIAQTNYAKQLKVYEQEALSELQVKTYQYQRDAAKAQMDLAQARLERTRVRSPFNGVLNARFFEAGEMCPPGAPIAHVVNLGRLKVKAGVAERYAGSFKVGDAVNFEVDAVPGVVFTGRMAFVGAAVSRDNRTIPIEVVVQGGNGQLKPDMIARMSVQLLERPNVIVIPETYVQSKGVDTYVVYVEQGGVARERRVTLGGSNKGAVLVTSGLSAGDHLITLGFQNVAEGQKISVRNDG